MLSGRTVFEGLGLDEKTGVVGGAGPEVGGWTGVVLGN